MYKFYVIVNNLSSMNPGKAMAHSGHAATLLYHNITTYGSVSDKEILAEWCGDIGFGTQINLTHKTDYSRTSNLMSKLPFQFPSIRVVDPTYPEKLTEREFLKLCSVTPSTPGFRFTLENTFIDEEYQKIYCITRKVETACGFLYDDSIGFINNILQSDYVLTP